MVQLVTVSFPYLISVVALAISLLALWKTHFAPFSALAVAGLLTLRIYPIQIGTNRRFTVSLNVPVSVTNVGARPGVITGLRLRLHFPRIPIRGNCELIPPAFEITPEDARQIGHDREWTEKIVVGNWMPFIVLPKATVTKHFVFESRWDDPVIQELVDCTLQIRSGPGRWRKVKTWQLALIAEIWSVLVDGSSISYPTSVDDPFGECMPPDLHKYTGK